MTDVKHFTHTIRFDEEMDKAIRDAGVVRKKDFANTVRSLLAFALAMDLGDAEPSVSDGLREQKQRLENETLAAKLAITKKEWIEIALIRIFLDKRFALVRSTARQWAQSVEGLTDAQRQDLLLQVEDLMAQLRAIQPDGWAHGPI